MSVSSAKMNRALHQLNWDDVRFFLAIMRSTSLREAADELGVSRPTVGRRLSGLEAQLGLKLFQRRPDGLHATAEAAELVDGAEEVERAMLALARTAHASNAELSGPLTVTLPGFFASELLMPDIVAFCKRWPRIDLRIDPGYGLARLDHREADVAIRAMPHGKQPAEELTGRLAATAYMAAYGSGDQWIGQSGGGADAAWVRTSPFPDLPVRGVLFDAHLQRSACAAGLGRAWLPCFFAEPILTRCSDPVPALDLWVLVHPDLRRSPKLRAFRDAMVDALRRNQPRLTGQS